VVFDVKREYFNQILSVCFFNYLVFSVKVDMLTRIRLLCILTCLCSLYSV